MLIERWFLRAREGTSRLLSLLAQEDGYSSEFAVITALAVAAGVVVAGIIVAKEVFFANSIQTK